MGIFQTIHIDNNLSAEIICQRIIENRERQMQRFNKGALKNEKYYNEQKQYVSEI